MIADEDIVSKDICNCFDAQACEAHANCRFKALAGERREKTDEELREIWLKAGGRFHGPIVETGAMQEDKLFTFLRSILK